MDWRPYPVIVADGGGESILGDNYKRRCPYQHRCRKSQIITNVGIEVLKHCTTILAAEECGRVRPDRMRCLENLILAYVPFGPGVYNKSDDQLEAGVTCLWGNSWWAEAWNK